MGWGAPSQGFSAPEGCWTSSPRPPPQAGRQLVPGGPSSILVCQRRHNSQTCRQPSPLRGEQTWPTHHGIVFSSKRKAKSQHALLRHGRFTVMLSLKEARQKGRGHTIPSGRCTGGTFRETESRWWGQGSGEREGVVQVYVDRVSAGKAGGALAVMAMTLVQQLECANALGCMLRDG